MLSIMALFPKPGHDNVYDCSAILFDVVVKIYERYDVKMSGKTRQKVLVQYIVQKLVEP